MRVAVSASRDAVVAPREQRTVESGPTTLPRARRTLLRPLVLLVAAAVVLGAGLPSAPAAADDPAGLGELERQVAALTDRLEKLIEEAERDPREHLLEQYLAYGPEIMKKRRKEVDAEMIVGWMADSKPTTRYTFREACMKALIQGTRMRGDYDLSADIRKAGRQTNRGYFYWRHVAPLLKDGDQVTRQLAQTLLHELYGRMLNHEEIAAYDPAKDRKSTWTPAVTAWKKFLKRK